MLQGHSSPIFNLFSSSSSSSSCSCCCFFFQFCRSLENKVRWFLPVLLLAVLEQVPDPSKATLSSAQPSVPPFRRVLIKALALSTATQMTHKHWIDKNLNKKNIETKMVCKEIDTEIEGWGGKSYCFAASALPPTSTFYSKFRLESCRAPDQVSCVFPSFNTNPSRQTQLFHLVQAKHSYQINSHTISSSRMYHSSLSSSLLITRPQTV